MRNTKTQIPIIRLLEAEPNLNSNQITEKTGLNPNSVKSVLCRLCQSGVLIRNKDSKSPDKKAGPQTLYSYSVAPKV